ncbi:MAG: RidA family protein [Gammaproteobacteria bacterium]|nr:RidA family protein [Gammaproteobacteria bacterium]
MSVEARLIELGLSLPTPFAYPSPNRRACVQVGQLLYLSGHPPPQDHGVIVHGKVGTELTEEQAYQSARATALALLSSARTHLGSLDRIVQIVKINGMVNSAQGFERQFAVIDGASDLLYELFGDPAGSHARSAVGMFELPRRFAVEIEAIFQIRD